MNNHDSAIVVAFYVFALFVMLCVIGCTAALGVNEQKRKKTIAITGIVAIALAALHALYCIYGFAP